MRPRVFSNTTALVVAFVLVLLVIALAVLQHQWFGQLSEREGERMRFNLQTGAMHCSTDFGEELFGILLIPGAPPLASADVLAPLLQQRLDIWRASTVYSPAVENVFFFDDSLGTVQRLVDGAWVAADEPPGKWSNPRLDRKAWAEFRISSTTGVFLRRDLRACCMYGLGQSTEDLRGPRVVVVMDDEYVVHTVIPHVLSLHLGEKEDTDLDILISRRDVPGESIFASSAAAAQLTPDRSDVVMPFVIIPPGPLTGSPRHGEDSPGVVRPGLARPERWTGGVRPDVIRPLNPGNGAFVQGPGGREFPFPSLYELLIRHRAGSLEAAVRKNRLMNLGLGTGILLLLVIGVAFILVSARRAGRLAQQQIEFVAGVSHELRTPLAVIQSVGDNLADGVVTDASRVKAYGHIIRAEVHRLSGMVENALSYAGIAAGKHQGRMGPVDLRDIVRKACQASQAMLEERESTVDLRFAESLPTIAGDAPALQCVLENLISNAVKYSTGRPELGIALTPDETGHGVEIAVRDSGIGISRQEVAHLFEPFFRGREAVQRQIRGSGLGLHLVHHIVERHGGTISVHSTPGQGSTVVVRLPST